MRRDQDDGEDASESLDGKRCPFGHGRGAVSEADFGLWRDNQVFCSAGRREFQLGRYQVEHVRNGYQFGVALECFRSSV